MKKLTIIFSLALSGLIIIQGCSKAYSNGSKEELPVTNVSKESAKEEPQELSPAREELLKLLDKEQLYAFEQNTQKYEDFELVDLDGKMKKLSHYDGKVIFLNFWATWCGPCRREMPSMQKLYDELGPKGFEIVAVNLKEEAKDIKAFMDSLDLTFPVLIDKTGQMGGFYGASSIPTTYIFDRKGFVVTGAVGTREWNTPGIKEILQILISEEG